jgi:hypothetical protein
MAHARTHRATSTERRQGAVGRIVHECVYSAVHKFPLTQLPQFGTSAHCSLDRPRKAFPGSHFHRRLYWRGARGRGLRGAGRMSSRSIDV